MKYLLLHTEENKSFLTHVFCNIKPQYLAVSLYNAVFTNPKPFFLDIQIFVLGLGQF